MTRLEKLKAMLAARTGPDGKPHPGFEQNVSALKAEIERLSRS